jgi:5-methylcytosine-specific restriction endonuclease McrA
MAERRAASPVHAAEIAHRFYINHRTVRLAAGKQWAGANRDKTRAYSKAWRAANKGTEKGRSAKWVADNPTKNLMKTLRRKARVLAAVPPGEHALTGQEWAECLEAFCGLCAYCGRPAKEVEHVVPLINGGSHVVANIVPSCAACNRSKGSASLLHWAMRSQVPFWAGCAA